MAVVLVRIRFVRALKYRPYALLWIGQTISALGDGAYFTALAWCEGLSGLDRHWTCAGCDGIAAAAGQRGSRGKLSQRHLRFRIRLLQRHLVYRAATNDTQRQIGACEQY